MREKERWRWFTEWTAPYVGTEGLYLLCQESIILYQEEVINNGKRYELYVDDFLNSHLFHDAVDAHSKNEHNRNLGRMKNLLLGNRPIVEKYFTGSTSYEQLALIFSELDRGEYTVPQTPFVSNPSGKVKVLRANNFGCRLTDEMVTVITECFNDCDLFLNSVSNQTVTQFFSLTLPVPFISKNLRLISLFFDGLYSYGIINRYWKAVIERNNLIVKSNTKEIVTSVDLSSALYAIRSRKMTAQDEKLWDYLEQLSHKDSD